MSGFGGGGGFGSGFGTPNQNNANNNNPFGGGGFGGSSGTSNGPGGFGNAAPASTPFGGSSGGFGSSNNNSNPNQPFGSAPAAAPFGGSNTSSSFGNSNTGGGMTFGTSPNVMVSSQRSSGFGSGNASRGGFGGGSGFGGGGSSSGFGGGRSTFGSQSNQQNKSSASSGFNNPFGGSQSQQSQQPPAPFGGTTQQSQKSSVTFGTSSNVVVNNGSTFGGGGNTGTSFGGNNTSSGFGTSGGNQGSSFGGSNAGSGFGKSSGSGGAPFGGGTTSSGFGKSDGSTGNPFGGSSTSSGFGKTGASSTSAQNPFGGGTTNSLSSGFGDAGASAPPFSGSKTSTIPEEGGRKDKVFVNKKTSDGTRKDIDSAQAKMEEKKRLLQAKIEEKKRKLLERKQKKKEEETRSKSPTPAVLPAKQSQGMSHRDPQTKPQMSNKSLAERNALRFAKHHNQPSVRSQSPVPSSSTGNSKEREDLKDAVNLVGLCQTMCPFEELEKRQNESDIQALEVPLPGTLHPPNWTVKDTAIKRFRRSAADYKLDVPEWVRPPEVLERTMGYLEEWIMERDRQGLDPRFPRKDIPPPPLDVYQFIWDRTRMIRKDFILQNYVGTGGRCDAKAVRVHERIARWHALCEHQLSHIEDFVKMQSQQNMQELGQTMKTLNSFYDDALDRSTKEVPDEKTGRETYVPDTNHTSNPASDKNRASRGGCLVDIVQGKNPMDYDGQLLNNAKQNPMIGQRIIGDNNSKTASRGTAEPEMRGIYMLLTMENEGGMEVLKYAAKLFKERPKVYHSPPVQLALTIFKTIKDMNYVKFFSILRSPSTPYLFACIMFKQVEIMRRIAIRIMSISYGARNKSTGEGVYDVYPLDRLMHVLCFEDLKEARKTCEFYNITVKELTSQRTGEVKEVIFWKGSKFKIPTDPEKGHTLHLKPQKMIRTIESKLNGATRLAICRGEVSGAGASLLGAAKSSNLNPGATSFIPSSMVANPPAEDPEAKARELLMKKKLEQARQEMLAKQKKELERQALEKHRMLEEKRKEEQRKKELEEKARQAELEKQRLKKLEEEKIRQKQEEERLRKIKEEEALARKMKEEKERKEAEEAARKQKELEEKMKREEEERKRLELERRIAEEKRKKQLEEEERRRREEEARRREILRLEREARLKREAEEKRKAVEWQKKIDAAAKILMWHRWKRTLSRPLEISVRSESSLREIDLSFGTDSFGITKAIMQNNRPIMQVPMRQRPTSKAIIEESLQDISLQEESKFDVASMALEEIESLSNDLVGHSGSQKTINLLKIALICPETMDIADQSYADLVYHWIGTRVNLGKVEIAKSDGDSKFSSRHEVRAVIVRGSTYEVCSSCDIALFVVPPHWSDPAEKARLLSNAASSLLDENIPRVALALNDDNESDQMQIINDIIAKELGGNMKSIPIIQPSRLSVAAFDGALEFAFRRIASLFINEACVSVIRIPAMHLATKVILGALYQCIPTVIGKDVDEDTIVECSRLSLKFLLAELVAHAESNEFEWSLWPAPEFSSHEEVVDSYFGENEGLPLQWARCLSEDLLREIYQPLLAVFRGHFRDAYQRIVVDAPIIVQDDCASECAQGQYRRCLQKALAWMQEDPASSGCYIYLPEGMVDVILKDVAAKVKSNLSIETSPQSIPTLAPEDAPMDSFIPKKIDYGVASPAGRAPESPAIGNDSLFPSNKRSRKSTNPPEQATKKKRVDPVPVTTPASSRSNNGRSENTSSASNSYAERLERLLHGEESVELNVGTTLLSRYLRGIPKPQV